MSDADDLAVTYVSGGVDQIAAMTGYSRRYVRRAIAELCRTGWLEEVPDSGGREFIMRIPDGHDEPTP